MLQSTQTLFKSKEIHTHTYLINNIEIEMKTSYIPFVDDIREDVASPTSTPSSNKMEDWERLAMEDTLNKMKLQFEQETHQSLSLLSDDCRPMFDEWEKALMHEKLEQAKKKLVRELTISKTQLREPQEGNKHVPTPTKSAMQEWERNLMKEKLLKAKLDLQQQQAPPPQPPQPQVSSEAGEGFSGKERYSNNNNHNPPITPQKTNHAALTTSPLQWIDYTEEEEHSGTMICTPTFKDILSISSNMKYLEEKYGLKIALRGNLLHFTSTDFDVVMIAQYEIGQLINGDVQHFKSQLEQVRLDVNADNLHIFVDNSNLIHCAQYEYSHKTGKFERNMAIRVNVVAVARIITLRRTCPQKIVVGSIVSSSASSDKMWGKWQESGFTYHLFIRADGAGEQNIDDTLISMAYEALLDYDHRTMVLVTGDGNDNHGRASFYKLVVQTLKKGWDVELWSWENSLNSRYLKLKDENPGPGKLHIRYLDEFRDKIIFYASTKNK